MRSRPSAKLVAALLMPMLLLSGAAQGLALLRCGSAVRLSASCCCPKEHALAASSQLASDPPACCDVFSVQTAPAQLEQRPAAPVPAPLPATAAQAPMLASALEWQLCAPRLEAPPSPSPFLTNRSLLI